MRNRQIITLLLIASLILLSACTSSTVEEQKVPEPQQVEKSSETEKVKDETTDIVIVGGGGAGMAAAIEATEGGAKVILVEKLPFLGGTTILASTAYNAGGSSVQMAMEKPYTADDFYAKIVKGKTDENGSIRRLADMSGETADWLIKMGGDLSKVINGSQHITSDGSAFGVMIASVLINKLNELGIDYRTNAKATEIIMEGDKAVGVKIESPDGNYNIMADAVILATGGFASNPEMVAEYTPQWAGYPSTASVGATGDGIKMAMAVGAAIGNMDSASPQTVAYDTGKGAVSLTNVRYNGAILVNEEAVRFVNELADTASLGAAIKAQTNGHAYLVLDQTSVDNAALMQEYKDRGYFIEANTIEELAAKINLDASTLTKTIETYQGYFDAGEDKEFGRKDSMFSRIDKAPYYASLISPASQTTNGGVMIDDGARALREDGTSIPGLYIGGETANQEGPGLTVAFNIGRLAAKTALADMKLK